MYSPEKKKKTDAAWKKRNKKTLACVVYKADAEDFAAYCDGRGISINEALRGYVAQCIGRPLEKKSGPGGSAAAAGDPD